MLFIPDFLTTTAHEIKGLLHFFAPSSPFVMTGSLLISKAAPFAVQWIVKNSEGVGEGGADLHTPFESP